MRNLTKFYYPETVEEALDLLRDKSENRSIVAGGSSVSLSRNDRVKALVDVTRMGLDYIKDGKGFVVIGATTRIQDIYKSPMIKEMANGMMSQAALDVASRPLRNSITLGGNIAGLRVWSDMPTILLALDATVKVRGSEERMIPAVDFFKTHPSKVIGDDSVVVEVMFPKTMDNSGGHYVKFSKTKGDYAIISVGCYLEFEDDTCSLARIAVGSVANLPTRIPEAEHVLEGNPVDDALIEKAAGVSRDSIKPVSNIWGSAEYKSELVFALVRRALGECVKKARS